jgi:hypothetical protein
MFLTKEAVRLVLASIAQGIGGEGCPPLAELAKRYEAPAATTWRVPSASTPATSTIATS